MNFSQLNEIYNSSFQLFVNFKQIKISDKKWPLNYLKITNSSYNYYITIPHYWTIKKTKEGNINDMK